MSRRIHLHVDRVVIDGAVPTDRAAFERALASSLREAVRTAATGPGLHGLRSSQRMDAAGPNSPPT